MTDFTPQDRDLENQRPARNQMPGGNSSRGPEVPPTGEGDKEVDASNAATPSPAQDDVPSGDYRD